MSFTQEKLNRIKYIRVLEKFLNSTVSMLKAEQFDIEKFKQKVDSHYATVCAVEASRLDKASHVKLLEYVNMCLSRCDSHTHGDDFEESRSALLKLANLKQKAEKLLNYKKSKHSKDRFKP